MRLWVSVVFASILTAMAFFFTLHGAPEGGMSRNHIAVERGFVAATLH